MSTEKPQPETENRKPAGSKHDAALPTGEVIAEYGIVDLNANFPAEQYEWQDEMIDVDNPPAREQHVVIPFRVIKRGISSLRAAKELVDHYEDERGGSFKAVLLSDTRGM